MRKNLLTLFTRPAARRLAVPQTHQGLMRGNAQIPELATQDKQLAAAAAGLPERVMFPFFRSVSSNSKQVSD